MLLDTDILIDLLRGNKGARDFLYSLSEDSPHYCSAITVAEIHSGMRETERQKTSEFIESLIVLPVTKVIAEMAGEFRRNYRNTRESPRGENADRKTTRSRFSGELKENELELDDCLIAATAVCEGMEFASRNVRQYPMTEVRLRPAKY